MGVAPTILGEKTLKILIFNFGIATVQPRCYYYYHIVKYRLTAHAFYKIRL